MRCHLWDILLIRVWRIRGVVRRRKSKCACFVLVGDWFATGHLQRVLLTALECEIIVLETQIYQYYISKVQPKAIWKIHTSAFMHRIMKTYCIFFFFLPVPPHILHIAVVRETVYLQHANFSQTKKECLVFRWTIKTLSLSNWFWNAFRSPKVVDCLFKPHQIM